MCDVNLNVYMQRVSCDYSPGKATSPITGKYTGSPGNVRCEAERVGAAGFL